MTVRREAKDKDVQQALLDLATNCNLTQATTRPPEKPISFQTLNPLDHQRSNEPPQA